MAELSQWLQLMLAEITRKQAEAERAAEEEERRAEEEEPQAPRRAGDARVRGVNGPSQ